MTAAGTKGIRRCTRTGCARPAVSTLTYVYADSTAVLGPLATLAEPHCYDLCAEHATRLTAPRGWDVVRLGGDHRAPEAGPDDLIALADAVREAARRQPAPQPSDRAPSRRPGPRPGGTQPSPSTAPRRGHLRVLRDDLG